MAYTYIAVGLLALTGFSGYYFWSTSYTDESNMYSKSAFYDGRTYARLYRDGIECGALKWKTRLKPPNATEVSPAEMDRILKNCKRYPLHNHPYRPLKMYPGTKWCGRGHRAQNFTDLGSNRALDTCCRDHDHCPLVIHSRVKNYGVTNTRLYTSSHCNCDENLYACLKNTNSTSAAIVGRLYFNYLRIRCFAEYVDHDANGTEQFLVRFRSIRSF